MFTQYSIITRALYILVVERVVDVDQRDDDQWEFPMISIHHLPTAIIVQVLTVTSPNI